MRVSVAGLDDEHVARAQALRAARGAQGERALEDAPGVALRAPLRFFEAFRELEQPHPLRAAHDGLEPAPGDATCQGSE